MDAKEYAHKIIKKYLTLAFSDETDVRMDRDPESIHHMRVSLRRALTAVKVFKKYISPAITKHQDFFQTLISALGKVRDLDVEILSLEKPQAIKAMSNKNERALVIDYLIAARAEARANLLAILNQNAYRNFVAEITEYLNKDFSSDFDDTQIDQVYKKIMHKLVEKFRKQGNALEEKSKAKSFHRLRILGKKLRYTLEFFDPLYHNDIARILEEMKQVQDELGVINDCRIAKERLERLASNNQTKFSRDVLEGINCLSRHFTKKEKKVRKKFLAAYEKLNWTAISFS